MASVNKMNKLKNRGGIPGYLANKYSRHKRILFFTPSMRRVGKMMIKKEYGEC